MFGQETFCDVRILCDRPPFGALRKLMAQINVLTSCMLFVLLTFPVPKVVMNVAPETLLLFRGILIANPFALERNKPFGNLNEGEERLTGKPVISAARSPKYVSDFRSGVKSLQVLQTESVSKVGKVQFEDGHLKADCWMIVSMGCVNPKR